jgi:hypothetical protein
MTYIVTDPQMRGWFVRPMTDGTTYCISEDKPWQEPEYAPAWEWGRAYDNGDLVVIGDTLRPEEAFVGPWSDGADWVRRESWDPGGQQS